MPRPQLVPRESAPPNLNAILDALRAALTPPTGGDAGFTTEELAAQTGIKPKVLLRELKRLHAEGRLIVGRQVRPCFSGVLRTYTVYRVTENEHPPRK